MTIRRLAPVIALFAFACSPEVDPGVGLGGSNIDATEATLHFAADWSQSVSGTPTADAPVHVDYASARLPCRDTINGAPAWTVAMHWRLAGGDEHVQLVDGHESFPGETNRVITPDQSGALEVWFENSSASGCHAWDSAYGANYQFDVAPDPRAPGWVGNAAVVISRETCGTGPCDADRHPLDGGFDYDTWTRERAAIRAAYFDVWKQGVTDFDNGDLWRQLDVQVHYRFDPAAAWQTAYVGFDQREGNNARYALQLATLDPLGGTNRATAAACPAVPLTRDPTGMYVRTTMQFYFTVSGTALRASDGTPFSGVFEDYAGLYAPCAVH